MRRSRRLGSTRGQDLPSWTACRPNKVERDRYGRIVGKIIFEGQDIDLAMVQAGYAWWYRKYAGEQNAGDRVLYEAVEAKAKTEHLGLWADPHPVPPWEWRKKKRASR